MKTVITTPTGNIGHVIAKTLLQEGATDVTVIARRAERVADLAAMGAKVVEGSIDDAETMKRATDGAGAIFCLTPPDMQTNDVRAHAARFGEAAAAAIRSNQIPYVVYNSGIGAELVGHSAEPLYSLRENEERYAAEAPNLVCGRPGWFMENLLPQAEGMGLRWRYWPKWPGLLFNSFDLDIEVPMVATVDIGQCYARLLRNPNWTGHKFVEVHGPGAITYRRVCEILSDLTGREVCCLVTDKKQMLDAMEREGLASRHMAEGFFEMGRELAEGRMRFQQDAEESRPAAVSFRQFAQVQLLPAIWSEEKAI